MSQENVELLGRMFELFSERELDWDALFELLGPDIVWEVRSDFPDAGVYTGHEGVRRLSDVFDEAVGETGTGRSNTSTSEVVSSCRFVGADWA